MSLEAYLVEHCAPEGDGKEECRGLGAALV